MWGQGIAQPCHRAWVGLSCWAAEASVGTTLSLHPPGDTGLPASAGSLHPCAGAFLLNYFKLLKTKYIYIYTYVITKCSALGLWVARSGWVVTLGQGDGTCPAPGSGGSWCVQEPGVALGAGVGVGTFRLG